MAFGILSILILVVVVCVIAIGTAFLVFMFINRGGPNKIPDTPADDEPVTRPSASQQSSIGCVLGLITVFIIGMLLAVGIVLTLFLGRRPMPVNDDQILLEQVEEIKQVEASDSPSVDSKTVDKVQVPEADPKPVESEDPGDE